MQPITNMSPLCSTPSRRFGQEFQSVHRSAPTEESDYVFYYNYKLEFEQRGLAIYNDVDKILENESDSDADSGVVSLDETDDFELLDLSDVWASDSNNNDSHASSDAWDAENSEEDDEPINTPSESSIQVQAIARSSPVSVGFRAVNRLSMFRRSDRNDSVARRRLFAESLRLIEDREE